MLHVELAFRYAACAAVAILINLATQWTVFRVYDGAWELSLGIGAGTMAGLVCKYLLDKFLIFDDRSLWLLENLQKFSQYTLTGLLTTAIFWTTEAGFAALASAEAMRYFGALIGLSIGYFVKFHLDYRFVFRARP